MRGEFVKVDSKTNCRPARCMDLFRKRG